MKHKLKHKFQHKNNIKTLFQLELSNKNNYYSYDTANNFTTLKDEDHIKIECLNSGGQKTCTIVSNQVNIIFMKLKDNSSYKQQEKKFPTQEQLKDDFEYIAFQDMNLIFDDKSSKFKNLVVFLGIGTNTHDSQLSNVSEINIQCSTNTKMIDIYTKGFSFVSQKT